MCRRCARLYGHCVYPTRVCLRGGCGGHSFAEPSCGICECMHTHLIHLCSLPAVMRCCARLLPLSHLPHLALLALSSSPRSFINPRCAGCGASHTVSTFFCHSQLFSDFPNTTRSLPSQPLSVSLPRSLPLSYLPFLSSITLEIPGPKAWCLMQCPRMRLLIFQLL